MDDAWWPDRLGVGDQVRFDGRACTVTEVYGRRITLTDASGDSQQVEVAALLTSGGFAMLHQEKVAGEAVPRMVRSGGAQVRRWQPHIVEVLTGLPPDAEPGSRPRPALDPALHSLEEREAAKADELTRLGFAGASARSVRRKRQRYEAMGPAGLADGRSGRREAVGARWDPRVLDAIRQAAAPDSHGRRRRVEDVRRQVLHVFQAEAKAGVVRLPSRATFHRLFADMEAAGLLDSARWPGRQVLVDSARLPLLPGQSAADQEMKWLCYAVDVDTRVLLTAVLSDQARPADGAAFLARILLPPDLRTTWPAGRPSSPLGSSRPQDLPPVIRPHALLLDHAACPGGVRGLAEACRRYGIHIQQPNVIAPQARRAVEFMNEQLVRRLTSYLHMSAGDTAQAATWPTHLLRELLDTWAVTVWPHEEPSTEASDFRTPGTTPPGLRRYAELTTRSGWVSTPPSPQVYLDLLRSEQRTVTASGMHVRGLRYDGPVLDEMRGTASRTGTSPAHQIRYDPYDPQRIWVRVKERGWTTVDPVSRRLPPPLPVSELRLEETAPPDRGPIPSRSPRAGMPSPSPDAPDQLRATYHAQLPLHTPDVTAAIRQAEELVLLNQHGQGARRQLLVCGEAGVGKTTVLLELARRFDASTTGPLPTPAQPPPVPAALYLRVPPAATPRILLAELAHAAGSPPRSRATAADLTRQVSRRLQEMGTRLVLIDELRLRHGARKAPSLVDETLAYLCDQVPATFVLATRWPAPATAGQPHSRLLTVPLRAMPPGRPFLTFLAQADESLRLRRHVPGTLPDMADHLHKATGGLPALLGHLIRNSALRAIAAGTERITPALIEELSPSQPPLRSPSG